MSTRGAWSEFNGKCNPLGYTAGEERLREFVTYYVTKRGAAHRDGSPYQSGRGEEGGIAYPPVLLGGVSDARPTPIHLHQSNAG